MALGGEIFQNPLAAEAVAGGKVKANGERVKVAKAIRVTDELRIHIGPYEYVVRVLAFYWCLRMYSRRTSLIFD